MRAILSDLIDRCRGQLIRSFAGLVLSSYVNAFLGILFSAAFVRIAGAAGYGEYVLYASYYGILTFVGSLGLGSNFIAKLANEELRVSDLTAYFVFQISLMYAVSLSFILHSGTGVHGAPAYITAIVLPALGSFESFNYIYVSYKLKHNVLAKFRSALTLLETVFGSLLLLGGASPFLIFTVKSTIDLLAHALLFARQAPPILAYIRDFKRRFHRSLRVSRDAYLRERMYFLSLNTYLLKFFDQFGPIIIQRFGSLEVLAYFNLSQKILSYFLLAYSYLENLFLSFYRKEEMARTYRQHRARIWLASGILYVALVAAQFTYFGLFVSIRLDGEFYLALTLFSCSILTYPTRTLLRTILISNGAYRLYFINNSASTAASLLGYATVISMFQLTLLNLSLIFLGINIVSTLVYLVSVERKLDTFSKGLGGAGG